MSRSVKRGELVIKRWKHVYLNCQQQCRKFGQKTWHAVESSCIVPFSNQQSKTCTVKQPDIHTFWRPTDNSLFTLPKSFLRAWETYVGYWLPGKHIPAHKLGDDIQPYLNITHSLYNTNWKSQNQSDANGYTQCPPGKFDSIILANKYRHYPAR
jgi:hypothetical protein